MSLARIQPTRPTLALALTSGLVLAGCSQEVSVGDDAPTAATLFPLPSTAPDRAAPTLSSVLYSERDAELRARARGVVTELLAELGDRVEAGQVLARLDDAERQAAFDLANATLELARLEHGRVTALLAAQVIEQAEADRSLYRLRAATAERDRASALLEHTRIRAPFDGVVARRFVRVGQMVEETDPLFRVTAPRPLRVRVMVPEERALRLAVGQHARLVGAGGSATATIARMAPAVDPASGSIEALLDVAQPGALRPGSAVIIEWNGSGPGSASAPERR
jgi:membrane fusion protein, multidrug efflux system